MIMDVNVIVTALVSLFTTSVGSAVSWFLAKRKYNVEVDSEYINNLQRSLGVYDSIVEHNKKEIEYLMTRNDVLEKEVSELRKQVLDLTVHICMDLTCQHRVRVKKEDKGKKDGAKAEKNSKA